MGYTLLGGVVDGSLPQSRALAAFAAWLMGTGCSTSLTAALGANYATFRDGAVHGRLVGLIMSFFGLSSGCLSLVHDVFFERNSNSAAAVNINGSGDDSTTAAAAAFLYFLAVFAGGVDVCSACVVGTPRGWTVPDHHHYFAHGGGGAT